MPPTCKVVSSKKQEMKRSKNKQHESLASAIIEKSDYLLTHLLYPVYSADSGAKFTKRRTVILLIMIIAVVLMHVFSSPERWIRI